jgi:hypothetical protein
MISISSLLAPASNASPVERSPKLAPNAQITRTSNAFIPAQSWLPPTLNASPRPALVRSLSDDSTNRPKELAHSHWRPHSDIFIRSYADTHFSNRSSNLPPIFEQRVESVTSPSNSHAIFAPNMREDVANCNRERSFSDIQTVSKNPSGSRDLRMGSSLLEYTSSSPYTIKSTPKYPTENIVPNSPSLHTYRQFDSEIALQPNPTTTTKILGCSTAGCRREFKSRSHLIRHERMHTGEKPFPCLWKGCTKKFSRRDNMNQHCLTHLAQNL